ncbi:hypothetical protein [Parafrankia sp. FMc2]|uniref:hypothetical protein n=1 Tax=Parafrankia sp. FMc2 TaxID=3233196 RepID=UPI0034D3EA51
MPAVALALLAHLPTARAGTPAPGRVLLVTWVVTCALTAAGIAWRVLRARLEPFAWHDSFDRHDPIGRLRGARRSGRGLCSFGGTLAVQASLHGAFLTGAGPTSGTSSPPVDGLLCAASGAGSPDTAGYSSSGLLAAALAGRTPSSGTGADGPAQAAAALASAGHHTGVGPGHTPAVLLAHTVAAALVVWWTRHGVTVLIATCRAIGSRLPTLRVALAPVRVIRPTVRATRSVGPRVLDRPWAAIAARGPPAWSPVPA